jgi:hypothetical protein
MTQKKKKPSNKKPDFDGGVNRMSSPRDPGIVGKYVFYYSNGWYWWDETQTSLYGPFRSRTIAEIALDRYAREL